MSFTVVERPQSRMHDQEFATKHQPGPGVRGQAPTFAGNFIAVCNPGSVTVGKRTSPPIFANTAKNLKQVSPAPGDRVVDSPDARA